MSKLLLTAVIIAIIVVAVGAGYAVSRHRHERRAAQSAPLERLQAYLLQRKDYLVYIGFPLDEPTSWRQAESWNSDTLRVGSEIVQLSSISLFVVAYPNGQVLDAVFEPLALPDGIECIESRGDVRHDVLDTDRLSEGARFAQVTFGPSGSRPGEPGYYATSLTNRSDKPIRVIRFGAFSRSGTRFVLNTIGDDFFSADDFVNWYGVGNDGWIEPGKTVTDPNNYGGGDGYWAYFCEAEGGEAFTVGAKSPARAMRQ